MARIHNVKLINLCFSCKKEHDLNDRIIIFGKESVTCDCGGTVISPSGKSMHIIKPTCKVFRFSDGETHWIASKTKEDAESLFKELSDNDDYTIEECPLEELVEKIITDEEEIKIGEPNKVSLIDILITVEHLPAVLAATVY